MDRGRNEERCGGNLDGVGRMSERTPVPCAECHTPTDPWDIFPKGKCLTCHARAHENDTPEQMFADIVRGFGGKR